MGPSIAESAVTSDLLKEAGYEYTMQWPCDDQPIYIKTRSGPLLNIPYPVEMNDVGICVRRHHTGREFAEMITDQFDEMLEQSEKQPLVYCISLHPFIVGQPFRMRPFREALRHIADHRDDVWLTQPGDIAAHVKSLMPAWSQGASTGSPRLVDSRTLLEGVRGILRSTTRRRPRWRNVTVCERDQLGEHSGWSRRARAAALGTRRSLSRRGALLVTTLGSGSSRTRRRLSWNSRLLRRSGLSGVCRNTSGDRPSRSHWRPW